MDAKNNNNRLTFKNLIVKNTHFENFTLLYSTIRVEVFNFNFSSNKIITEILDDIIICEKRFYGIEMSVYNNSGLNTTFLKVFDRITL